MIHEYNYLSIKKLKSLISLLQKGVWYTFHFFATSATEKIFKQS